jgi:hypothetical protein
MVQGMELFIQMGHGMKSICHDLSALWGGATVILSPLNYKESTLPSFSKDIRKMNGRVLLDPQMYSPRKYHRNLAPYSYWPQSGITGIELGDYGEVLRLLYRLNEQVESDAFILPSNTISKIDERWNHIQKNVSENGRQIANGRKVYHTIALSGEVLSDESQIESIIQYAGYWDVDGVYIVCEHPNRHYLVDKPLWIINLLNLVAGIKRQGKSVIVGYASHQMLCLALAKCDAIAAGHLLNVRWFKPERFKAADEDDTSRRTTWYYCPQALTEYKVIYLDVAKRVDMLKNMMPPESMRNDFSNVLFGDALPSSTGYSEADSHRHYLHCLKLQCATSSRATYEETRSALIALLGTAARLTAGLRNWKIKGQDRDFSEIVDVIEAAISVFDEEFGFVLSREWGSM